MEELVSEGSPRLAGKLQCLQPSACVRHCALPQHSAVAEQLVHMARQDPSSSGKMKKPSHSAHAVADSLHQASLPPDRKEKKMSQRYHRDLWGRDDLQFL
jgi:hypothetical protein